MTNPFLKGGVDTVYAETINDSQLFSYLLNPVINLTLPTDYDAGNFLINENKAKFVLVNLILSNTQITGNQIALVGGHTTGTATFRIYPNIMPFKQWGNMTWTTTHPGASTITCALYKAFGVTLVDASYTTGEDMSAKGCVLEYVDFVFTLTADGANLPTLNTLTLTFTGGN